MSMTVLYRDQSWWLQKDKNGYWLRHTCIDQNNTVRRGLACSYDQFRLPEVPCSYCQSICPKPLQGLYNMMVYL